MNACRSWHRVHSNVRRSMPRVSIGSISLIEGSPPHAGHSPSTPMGADWGACALYPFAVERSASPWKVQVRLGPSYNDARSCLSVVPLTHRVCAILTSSPTLSLAVSRASSCAVRSRQGPRGAGIGVGLCRAVLPITTTEPKNARTKARAAISSMKGPDVWRRSSTGGSITKKFTLKDQSRDQSCLPERRRARSPITSTARPIPAAAEQQQHYDDYQKQFHERSPLMVMSGDSVCAGALFTSSNAPFNEPTTKLSMCRRIISNAHKAKGFRSHQTT
jgi:hypothetical protein